jgi:hypothetical protein
MSHSFNREASSISDFLFPMSWGVPCCFW